MMIKKIAFTLSCGLLLSGSYVDAGKDSRSSSDFKSVSIPKSLKNKSSSRVGTCSTNTSECSDDEFDEQEDKDGEGWGGSFVSSLRNGCGKISGTVAAGLTAVSAVLAAAVVMLVGGSNHSAQQEEHNQY